MAENTVEYMFVEEEEEEEEKKQTEKKKPEYMFVDDDEDTGRKERRLDDVHTHSRLQERKRVEPEYKAHKIQQKLDMKSAKPPFAFSCWDSALPICIIVLIGIYAYITLPIVWYTHPVLSADSVITYPLLQEPHNTTSVAFTGNETQFPLETMAAELRLHLALHPRYLVLCSHHLLLPDEYEYYQLCVLRTPHRNEYITMINPRIIGQSEEKSLFAENSVACSSAVNNTRAERIVVEWTDAENRIYSLLDRRSSVAMQLVLDELIGDQHCNQ
jgi:hypothetical protein